MGIILKTIGAIAGLLGATVTTIEFINYLQTGHLNTDFLNIVGMFISTISNWMFVFLYSIEVEVNDRTL